MGTQGSSSIFSEASILCLSLQDIHTYTHTQHMQKALANGADPHSLETSSGRTALHKVLGDGNLDDGNWVS